MSTPTTPIEIRDVSTDAETRRLVAEFKTARRAAAMWRDRESEIRERLLKLFHVTGQHAGRWEAKVNGLVIFKVDVVESRRFNAGAFREDHPDLYDRYREPQLIPRVVTAGTTDPDEPAGLPS